MASRLSDANAAKILDHFFGGVSPTYPATLYLALLTTAPSNNTGSGVVEVSGSAYARVAVTRNQTNFPAAASRAISSGIDFIWPTPTGSWGTVVGVAMYSASSGGTYEGYAALPTGQSIVSGNVVKIAAGDLDWTSSGA